MILEDIGQKIGQHETKNNWFSANGIEVKRAPLPCGDYVLMNDKAKDVIDRKAKREVDLKKMDFLGTYKVSVDTKKDLQEIIGNICGKSHGRFRDECILAQNNGVKLYVLVENEDKVLNKDDLLHWNNPRAKATKWITTPSGERRKVLRSPNATSGETLAKAMRTMEEKYGVEFLFCSPYEAGKVVLELLNKSME